MSSIDYLLPPLLHAAAILYAAKPNWMKVINIHNSLPDMIIDIRMPRINGFDLYRQLKKMDTSVKVCFLTAFQIYYEEFRKMFPTIDVKAFIRKNQSAYQT